jgi:hypothetical protein
MDRKEWRRWGDMFEARGEHDQAAKARGFSLMYTVAMLEVG